MGSQAEPWNEVIHKNCMKEKYENYNKVNSLPKDYGIDYKDVKFTAYDGVQLVGWLLNENAEYVFLVFHCIKQRQSLVSLHL